MKINIEKTYFYLIKHIEIYFSILENKKNSNILELQNSSLFPEKEYTDILEEYINTNNFDKLERKNIKEILSIDNLKKFNIFFSNEKIVNYEHTNIFSISSHIIDMVKNIYKEYANPLTNSNLAEFEVLMNDYYSFFSNEMEQLNKKQYKEKIDSFFEKLEDVNEKLNHSVNTLKFKKERISDNNKDDKKTKLKKAKELQDKYINPLNYFIHMYKSKFMVKLNDIRIFFEKENKYELKRKIDFYIKEYLLFSKSIQPIRDYISNYIKQEEREMNINLGSEYLFNKLNDLYQQGFQGNNKKYIQSLVTEQDLYILCKNIFFKNNVNLNRNGKDLNIKQHKINRQLFEYCENEITNKEYSIKRNKEYKKFNNIINKEFELKRQEQERKTKFLNELKQNFDLNLLKQLKENNQFELIDYIYVYLNMNYQNQWNIFEFQYLLINILKNKTFKLIRLETFTVIKNYKFKNFIVMSKDK